MNVLNKYYFNYLSKINVHVFRSLQKENPGDYSFQKKKKKKHRKESVDYSWKMNEKILKYYWDVY